MIGCDFHVRKIAKNVFDFAHGKSPKIFKDFLKLTVLSFSEFNFTCLFSELSHKNVSFNGKWLDKIFIFSKSGTINDFETESYIFYTGYLYFQLFSFLWFLILKKIKILSSDFPLKETFFLDNSENRQVKLNSEHDKTSGCNYGLDIFFSISKCRTAGRHAGVDLTGSTPNRVLSVHRSIDTYREVTLTMNSVFTQSLQFINSFYSLKCRNLSFYLS